MTGSCEPLNTGAGNRTCIPWKSRKYSYPLSQLSSSFPNYLFPDLPAWRSEKVYINQPMKSPQCGNTHLQSQHLRGRNRRILSLEPTWAILKTLSWNNDEYHQVSENLFLGLPGIMEKFRALETHLLMLIKTVPYMIWFVAPPSSDLLLLAVQGHTCLWVVCRPAAAAGDPDAGKEQCRLPQLQHLPYWLGWVSGEDKNPVLGSFLVSRARWLPFTYW